MMIEKPQVMTQMIRAAASAFATGLLSAFPWLTDADSLAKIITAIAAAGTAAFAMYYYYHLGKFNKAQTRKVEREMEHEEEEESRS